MLIQLHFLGPFSKQIFEDWWYLSSVNNNNNNILIKRGPHKLLVPNLLAYTEGKIESSLKVELKMGNVKICYKNFPSLVQWWVCMQACTTLLCTRTILEFLSIFKIDLKYDIYLVWRASRSTMSSWTSKLYVLSFLSHWSFEEAWLT